MSITYSNNICWNVRYKGLRLVLSIVASKEALYLKLDLYDCKKILENRYSPRKRGKDTEEKWFDKGNKIYNVVIVKQYNYSNQEDIYLITHIGRFTK